MELHPDNTGHHRYVPIEHQRILPEERYPNEIEVLDQGCVGREIMDHDGCSLQSSGQVSEYERLPHDLKNNKLHRPYEQCNSGNLKTLVRDPRDRSPYSNYNYESSDHRTLSIQNTPLNLQQVPE